MERARVNQWKIIAISSEFRLKLLEKQRAGADKAVIGSKIKTFLYYLHWNVYLDEMLEFRMYERC